MSDFIKYRRSQIAELRPFQLGDNMTDVSVSTEDRKAGSPKLGDMIARNPKNHDDQWLVAAQYFADNFEPAFSTRSTPSEEVRTMVQVDKAELLALLRERDEARAMLDLIREEAAKDNSPYGRSDSLAIKNIRATLTEGKQS